MSLDHSPDEDDCSERICPMTNDFCRGRFCEDYGCARQSGFFDEDEPVDHIEPIHRLKGKE